MGNVCGMFEMCLGSALCDLVEGLGDVRMFAGCQICLDDVRYL